jgi:hypothetical protein
MRIALVLSVLLTLAGSAAGCGSNSHPVDSDSSAGTPAPRVTTMQSEPIVASEPVATVPDGGDDSRYGGPDEYWDEMPFRDPTAEEIQRDIDAKVEAQMAEVCANAPSAPFC